MDYPIIKRDIVDFTSDTEVCNIGYNEGTLKDGRPYRIEVWSAFGIETATIFISTQDIEDKDVKYLKKLIQDNKIIDIYDDRLDVTRTVDYEENELQNDSTYYRTMDEARVPMQSAPGDGRFGYPGSGLIPQAEFRAADGHGRPNRG